MKKIIVSLLTLVFVISGMILFQTDSSNVLAADSGYEAIEYTNLSETPTAPEGYLFAGWYKEADCKTVYRSVEGLTSAYAKFVPADVLSIKLQLKQGTTPDSETTNMRLVSSVDSLNYNRMGFEIYFNGAATPVDTYTTKVYERIKASETSGVSYNYSSKIVDEESEYFVTATLIDIKKANFGKNFYIRPYWETLDGTMVYGVDRYVTVSNGWSDTNINVPVYTGDTLLTAGSTQTVTVAGTEYSATVAYCEEGYTHINIPVTNRDSVLKSVSSIEVKDGEKLLGKTTWRNLNTSYTGSGTEDTSWNTSADKLIIATSADLWGFNKLSQDTTNQTLFENKEIYVVADIDVGSSYTWTPLYQTEKSGFGFKGTFDGQKHTISNITCSGGNTVGFFGWNQGGTIRDFMLKDSTFTVTGNNVGSIVARGFGTYEKLYSDASVEATGTSSLHVGGMFGYIDGTTSMSECWFAGSVRNLSVQSSTTARTGGVIGCVQNKEVTMKHCLNTGTVSVSSYNVGGIIGELRGSSTKVTLNNCFNTGDVTSTSTGGVTSGTIIGAFADSSNNGKHVFTNVYGLQITTKDCTSSQVTGITVISDASSIRGFGSYSMELALLDADNNTDDYWVARANSTPELAYFAESGLFIVPDTRWYSADVKDGDYYVIDSAEDLYGLSKLVCDKKITSSDKIKLATDIEINEGKASDWVSEAPKNEWIPIGKENVAFAGNFYGDGHTISGVYCNYANNGGNGVGFFGYCGGGNIEDFRLENSYIAATDSNNVGSISGRGYATYKKIYSNAYVVNSNASTGYHTGGFVGYTDNTTTMEECWFDGEVNVTKVLRTAGFVGGVGATTTISHCLNSGSVTSNVDQIAGLCGYVNSKSLTISDSLNLGKITTTATSGNVGKIVGAGQITNTTPYTNVYGVDLNLPESKPSITQDITGEYIVTEAGLTGFGAYTTKLELISTDDTEDYWVARANTTPGLAYFTERGLFIAPDTSWYEADVGEEGYYVIDTAEDLYGLSKLVYEGTITSTDKIKLAADIEINEGKASDWGTEVPKNEWIPIGKDNATFVGEFNGCGHTISGVYCNVSNGGAGVGLFGYCTNATVEDFRLENSYFKAAENNVGSISGRGYATYKKIYSNAYVENSNTTESLSTGGILGHVSGATTMEECWFDGQVNATQTRRLGGLIGAVEGNATINHCLNTGDVISNYYELGGLCGYVGSSKTLAIRDSLNLGNVTSTQSGGVTSGRIVGKKADNATVTYTNVYGVEVNLTNRTADISDEYVVTAAELTGDAAKTNASGLDWTNYWGPVLNDTPVLKCFMSLTNGYSVDTD